MVGQRKGAPRRGRRLAARRRNVLRDFRRYFDFFLGAFVFRRGLFIGRGQLFRRRRSFGGFFTFRRSFGFFGLFGFCRFFSLSFFVLSFFSLRLFRFRRLGDGRGVGRRRGFFSGELRRRQVRLLEPRGAGAKAEAGNGED